MADGDSRSYDRRSRFRGEGSSSPHLSPVGAACSLDQRPALRNLVGASRIAQIYLAYDERCLFRSADGEPWTRREWPASIPQTISLYVVGAFRSWRLESPRARIRLSPGPRYRRYQSPGPEGGS